MIAHSRSTLPVEALFSMLACCIWGATACAQELPFQKTVSDPKSASSAEPPATLSPDERVFFEKQVRPLIVERCFACHAGTKAGGGLSLETAKAWQKGGENGQVIVPGQPDKSLLIDAINYRHLEMPPADQGGKLSDQEIAILTQWVQMGAPDPRDGRDVLGGMSRRDAENWWAFQPLPQLSGTERDLATDARRIDDLLQPEIVARSLTLAPVADRRTLLRRLTYGLTGLPPTAQEVDAFAADRSSDAFSQVVERLLASPQYGVHWGRHWLDVVRYADTAGENTDRPLPHAWRYRNWVFRSFQIDLPFDQFVHMQLAGDLLTQELSGAERSDGIVATGYLAIARRFGHDIDKDMYLTYEDVIDNLGKNFLGLTLGCARCHDHKYDPVSSEDYYALYGIFESTRFAFPGCEPKGQPRDLVPLLAKAEIDDLMQPWQERVAQIEVEKQSRQASTKAVGLSDDGSPPVIPVAYAVVDGETKNARMHQRGDPEKLGEHVMRRWLTVFGGMEVPENAGSGRRELGQWVSEHPLAARVMVNRIWQWHFGHGLVRSSSDFGSRGEPPTHPELLDFLAARFVQSGYSTKEMHRLILQTAAYQRASATPVDADPENRWLAHFSRRRLTAEEFRDSVLTVSGQLDSSAAEGHPFPDEKTWTFTQHTPFSAVYDTNRRSAYMMVQRQRRHPYLALFDGADPNASTPSRQTTTVPTQALFFINDPFFHSQAKSLAEILLEKSPEEARLLHVYRLLFQRQPTTAETARFQEFQENYPGDPEEIWSALVRVLMASNEFSYVD